MSMQFPKKLIKYSIVLLLILLSGYGYLSYFKIEEKFVPTLQANANFQETQQPANNRPYLTFHHPFAPPYPYPYQFLFSQADKCKGRNPFLVIMVVGEVSDVESRHGIRKTWGDLSLYDVDIVRIFLVGLANVASDKMQMLLEEESFNYRDIVQQDFIDTHYNLTLKTLMGMEWVNKFCPTASYVMKIDNDVFFNVNYLVHSLLHPELPVRTDFFTGYIVSGTGPIRDRSYMYYVPVEVYPNDTYQPYCGGPGYVFSVDMAKKIYDISQVIRVIPIEDAFMGICLYELKIPITVPPEGIFNGDRIDYDRCLFHKLVTVHHYGIEEQLLIWDNFWNKKTKGCDKRKYKRSM